MLVYDVTDPSTKDSISQWRDDFIFNANIKNPDNFPFVVIGNKVDLNESSLVCKFTAVNYNTNTQL